MPVASCIHFPSFCSSVNPGFTAGGLSYTSVNVRQFRRAGGLGDTWRRLNMEGTSHLVSPLTPSLKGLTVQTRPLHSTRLCTPTHSFTAASYSTPWLPCLCFWASLEGRGDSLFMSLSLAPYSIPSEKLGKYWLS